MVSKNDSKSDVINLQYLLTVEFNSVRSKSRSIRNLELAVFFMTLIFEVGDRDSMDLP